jgi:hypothetical protein
MRRSLHCFAEHPGRPHEAGSGRTWRPCCGQFEYEAALLAADGKTGIDTAWLREQLDMPSDLAD